LGSLQCDACLEERAGSALFTHEPCMTLARRVCSLVGCPIEAASPDNYYISVAPKRVVPTPSITITTATTTTTTNVWTHLPHSASSANFSSSLQSTISSTELRIAQIHHISTINNRPITKHMYSIIGIVVILAVPIPFILTTWALTLRAAKSRGDPARDGVRWLNGAMPLWAL